MNQIKNLKKKVQMKMSKNSLMNNKPKKLKNFKSPHLIRQREIKYRAKSKIIKKQKKNNLQ